MTHRRFAIAFTAAALLPIVLLSNADAAFVHPQAAALDDLRAASAMPVQIRFRHGFPVSVQMDVPATGATDVERAREFLVQYRDLYLLDHPEVELVHVRSDSHPVYGETVRFAQRAWGFPVLGAEIAVHLGSNAGGAPRVLATSGMLLIPAQTDRTPPIDREIDLLPAITPETAESVARADLGIAGAPLLGRTIMMIHDAGMVDEISDPRLVWRVGLLGTEPMQYLVDANTGGILLRHSVLPQGNGLDDFDLDLEHAHGGTMVSTNCFNPTTIDEEIGDEDGVYSQFLGDTEAVLAWGHARSTYLTFHDTFGRHSYDDDDGSLEVYVHSGAPNASGTAACGIEFANGWVSKDVVGHEFAHMVIDETSSLVPMNQSGALNESFADLMGAVVDPADWLIAEDRTSGLGAIRNLSNPPALTCFSQPCPDRMSQYIATSMDAGGVHANSLIVSKAFTLMADGGSFNGVTVTGMGRAKVAQLAYRSFTTLGWFSQFADLRSSAILWATYFDGVNAHGFTSQDVCTVRNALAAVEIGFADSDCDGVEDNVDDSDGDGILDNGDGTGGNTNYPCPDGVTANCDDNCRLVANPGQADSDGDGAGDACDNDSDNDGVPDWMDHCPGFPGSTGDTDMDGIYDCFDPDDDQDGILDDGDASGMIGDNPCPSNVTVNCDDNCIWDANPTQFDGNGDGLGDACDPDVDGDGWYGAGGPNPDNCPFTYNPTQFDADADGLGDACDKCPNVPDNSNTWHTGYPDLGIDPYPIQNDSDGDGIPDACDGFGWGSAGAFTGGAFYYAGNALAPDGSPDDLQVMGPPGSILRLPFLACDNGQPEGPGTEERVELIFEGLPGSVDGWVEDGVGQVRAWIRTHNADPALRGLRFRPRCDEEHFLVLRTDASFPGSALFQVTAESRTVGDQNPWSSSDLLFPLDPPTLPPDTDADGLWDGIDTCPTIYDPTNADADRDGMGDLCDATPGGSVTVVITGHVMSFDDGSAPPDFQGLAAGMPFTGTLTWDTTMPVTMEGFPVSMTYGKLPPLAPLGLHVVVAGYDLSSGDGAPLEILVEDGGPSGDRFVVSSADVAEHTSMMESLTLVLGDPTAQAFQGIALPSDLKPAEFSERCIMIDLDGGTTDSFTHIVLEITQIIAPWRGPQLYWLDSGKQEINRSETDGAGIVTLAMPLDPRGFQVDPAGGRIYWTEGSAGKVRRSDLDGSGPMDLATGLGFPFGIALDGPSGMLLFAQSASPRFVGAIPVGGGSPAQVTPTEPATPFAVAVDETRGKVYWTESGAPSRIRRANVDGTSVETLIDGSIDPLSRSQGLALDVGAGKMYWTDADLDRIYRANLDGTSQELLADASKVLISDPTGIAIDPVRGKIYWADARLHTIQRANLDGTSPETVLGSADGLSFPRDLFVDPGTACEPPTQALSMDFAEHTDGVGTTLTMTDLNAPGQVTGFNVYRSLDPARPLPEWSLQALDVPPDPILPGIQWTDTSGNPPAGQAYFYRAVAYNSGCPLEGPQ